MKSIPKRWAALTGVAALALAVTACGSEEGGNGGSTASGSVAVDGSSTVYPMSVAAQELLNEQSPNIKVTVGESGTGGGFEKFCAGQTDVSDASRPIKDEEKAVCAENGVEFTELQVATDALTIAVHKDLEVDCLTVDQIGQLFGPDSKVKNWKELDPSFPDQEVKFFIPGTDSGTYDYMAADVFENEAETLRTDVESSEDDNVLVQGISGTKGAVGFFGFTYYEENEDTLKALEVDGGSGCVAPSVETAQDGSYTPLARPLFIYVNNAKYADNAAAKEYVDFYVANLADIAEIGKFIPLSDELYSGTKTALEGLES